MLIALRILCDGKTTVLKGWGGGVRIDMYTSESFYGGKGRGGGGGEEIFAMAEVRVIIAE